ncbi:MAG: FG-GAP-like repeat-containing protein, partial [Bacteroidota bacterium]
MNTQLKSSLQKTIPSWGRLILVGMLSFLIGNIYSQSFSDITVATWEGDLVAAIEVSSVWADVNNDGSLDLIYSGLDTLGLPISGVYLNSGAPNYTLSRYNLGGIPGLKEAALAAGDVDNDGDIDVLISGETFGGSFITDVYKNDGEGAFASAFTLEGISRGAISLGDLDNDGDLDAVTAGESASGVLAEVYLNNGNGNMNSSQTLLGLVDGDIDLGDFDADGDLDMAICGADNLTDGDANLIIYTQDGTGNFSSFEELTGFVHADLEWSDLNTDGILELVVAGATSPDKSTAQASVFVFDGDDGFSASTLSGIAIVDAKLAIGDYTNDGLSDVLITGEGVEGLAEPAASLVLLKNGSTSVMDVDFGMTLLPTVDEFSWTSELVGIQRDVRWMDINNDSKLDFISLATIITAEADTFESFVIYENILDLEPLALVAPTDLTLSQEETTLIISWTDNANTGEITYQLGLGSEPGTYDIISPNFVSSTSTRSLAERGKWVGPNTFKFNGLANGTYYAVVQAIGANFQVASTPEASGALEDPLFKDATAEVFDTDDNPFGLFDGEIAFADINSDGNQDLIVAGNSSADPEIQIYENDGDASFSAPTILASITQPQLEFADLDLDGNLDIMVFGFDGGDYKWLAYKGEGNGSFSLLSSGIVDNVTSAVGKLGDFNGDGNLDMIIAGEAGGSPFTTIYQNINGTFSALAVQPLAPISQAALALADFNKDGRTDIFLSGNGTTGNEAYLYEGQGNFQFSTVTTEVNALQQGNAVWGDYDSDGDLDLLLSGKTGDAIGTASTVIYSPNGTGVYNPSGLTLPAIDRGEVKWADFNEDGLLDILFVGQEKDTELPLTALFRYDLESGSYLPVPDNSLSFPGIQDGQLAWGFANDDQKLDFAIQGKDASDAIIFKLYLNGEESENFSPGVPQDLTTDIGQQNITLSWNPPAGSTARVEGFSYHVFVGNAADTEDISSPPSLIDNGTHLISEFGAQSAKLVLPRDSFPEGTYYWGVQAIDQDFEGSTFATTTFTIQGPDFSDVTTLADLDGFSNTKAALAWGDYQNDGDLDLFMLGEKDGNAAVAFFVNQGDETFDIASLGIAALTDGDAVFWDYNGDRFLDLIISGDNAGQAETRLYKGNEDGSFTEVNAGITGVRNSSSSVGDFDRDGDMDLLLAGITQADVRISTIFENQGSDTFAELAGLDLPGVNAAVKWIDVNNDGWMDIILSGEGTDGPIATIYLNQTNKTFSQDTQSSLTAVSNSSLDLADIDNDGDTDLILTGDADGTATAIIYENNDGVLAEKQSLTGIKNGEARFGDLDNDGFVDIIISGESQDGSSITQLYLNSAGIFSLSTINSDFFEGLTNSALAVGDFDQDESKDLDFILTGTNSEGESIKLYKNNYDVEFTTPAAPTSLVANQQGTKAILSWEAATGSQASGYQYNILMESAASGGELIPALSDKTTGFRKVVSIGNVGQVLQTEVNGLVPGEKYTWQVQSIDQAFRGSSFSTADEFAIEQLPFEEEFDVVFNLVLDGFTESTLKLVDVDSDGDLEVVGIGADKNGTPTSFILQNAINENAGMTFQALPLGLKDGDIAAADVDNDGDIDLFLCGDDGAAARSVLYLNNGSGGFTASTFSFNGILGGDAEWADLDNDGDVDLVVSGNNGSIARTFTYVNQLDQGTFLLQITTLPGLERGAIHLADVNNDGITDVLMSGSDGTQLSGVVAINDGELAFTLDEDELPGFLDAALAAGDVDNDGDIDVFVSGNVNLSGSTLLTELYINDGTGDFQKDDLDLTDVSNGTLVLLDIDLDGKRDLILQGAGTANVLELWNNETLGNDISFEKDDVNSALFPALGGGSGVVVGDLDGNSTPDLLFTGLDDMGTTPAWYFFSNGGAEGNNTMAPAPGGLAASQSGSTALLSWNTRENGETYNFYVGSTTGTLDKNSPDAIISSGRRLLLADGNAGHNNATTLKDLAPGTYFWAVQAVDHDGEGSPFSAEATFEIAPPFFADVTETAFTAVPEGVENGALTWGDYESDGDLDLLVTGTRDGNPSTQLFVNNGDGTFQEINSGLVNIQAGDALFFDGNNDGILDILLTGETNADPVSIYYVGSMNGSFTETQNLTGVRNSSASVRDFDRDGDLDLILAGIDKDDNRITSLYRNDGASFSEVSGTAFAGVNANISWWDYNNDGNPDILITGEGSDGPLTALYENQGGSGSFSEVADLGIPGLSNSSVSIGDYDNDGDEDLLVSGSAGLEFITRLYRNDNGSVNAAIGFEGVRNGSTAFGDYNHDGFLDILLTGEDEGGEPFALLYLNNTDDTFTLDLINSPVFTGLRASQAAFGDFDRDGNNTLDIIMMGSRSAGSFLTLYKNSTTQPNLQPTAPTGLSSQQQGNIITLSWERPTGGSAGGYSFNVLLRAVATGEVIFSAQADNNGLRRILGLG